MAEFSWFRVETDADGAIVSCVLVEAAGKAGPGVFYVEAFDLPHARKLGESSFAARRLRKRRAEWSKAGRCTKCGGERGPTGKRCSVCQEMKRAENARAYRRGRGEFVPAPTRQEGAERRQDAVAASSRAETLREVLRWFHALPDRRRFLSKLEELIASESGKDRAA